MHLLLEALYLFSFFFWAPISPSVHQIWLSWCALLPYTPLMEQMRQMQSTLRLGEDWAHRKCQEWQLLASYPLLNFPSLFPKTSEEPLFNPVYLNTLSTPHPPHPPHLSSTPPHPHPRLETPLLSSEVKGCLCYQIPPGTKLLLLTWALPIFSLPLIRVLLIYLYVTNEPKR